MIQIRKELEGLLILNNEIVGLQSQQEEQESQKKQFDLLTETPVPKKTPRARVKKAQDKEQDQMLKILPNLMQQIQDQIPDNQSNSEEVNSLLAEQTHLQMLVNLFTGIEEISQYQLLDHFMTLNATFTYELNNLTNLVLDNKRTLLKQLKKKSPSFYSRRLKTYYNYMDHSLDSARSVQQQLLLKKHNLEQRLSSIYM